MLNIDSTVRLDRPSQQQDLIQAVLAASDADELWVEWKSGLDLRSKPGHFTVARAVLGFANRMPDDAQRFADGYAYVLVGVEPGRLSGVTEVDSAQLYPGIEQYCGPLADGPRYHLTYVPFDDGQGEKKILLVEVGPPRWGDPIHTLRKDLDNTLAGTIFVRRPGRTTRADPREVQLLGERFRRQTVRLALTVTEGVPIRPVQAAPEDHQRWLNKEAAAVRRSGPAPARPHRTVDLDDTQFNGPGTFGAEIARLSGQFDQVWGLVADRRTPADYAAETEDYLAELAAALPQAVLDGAAAHLAPMRLQLSNQVSQNLTSVELVLDIPGHLAAMLARPEPDGRYTELPSRPLPFGSKKSPYDIGMFNVLRAAVPPSFRPRPRPRISATAQGVRIVFPSLDIRPERTVDLDPIVLLAYAPAEPVAKARWSATATNIDAVARGTLDLPVEAEPLTLEHLFKAPPNWGRSRG